MYKTKLRKVGGSVMLAVPPALLEVLRLAAGSQVGIEMKDGSLVVAPRCFTLAELMASSDYSQPQPPEERKWVDAAPVGGELI
jgi:antitoxin ChpS